MRIITFAALALSLAGTLGVSAQMMHQHHGPGPVEETRELVTLPAPMVTRQLTHMRDHLMAIQQIQQMMGEGKATEAGKLAEEQLGMSSLGLHGAAQVGPMMPQGMRDAGMTMHRAASRFALAATDSGVSGDLKPALSALSEVTAACVGCHAGYRFR